MVLFSRLCKREEAVETCNEIGIYLYCGDVFLHPEHQLVIKLCLKRQYFVLRTENFLLVFLQFLRDVSFCLSQRLLTNPALRNLVFVGVSYLQIISEDVVITYLKRRNARLLSLSFLYFKQVVLAAIRYLAQLVELGVNATLYHPALVHQLWRVVLHLFLDAAAKCFAEIHLLPYPSQRLV